MVMNKRLYDVLMTTTCPEVVQHLESIMSVIDYNKGRIIHHAPTMLNNISTCLHQDIFVLFNYVCEL